jgi:putative transposase
VLQVLHEDKHVDKSPPAVYASLLDEGIRLCSPRTMYRILKSRGEVVERRRQTRRYDHVKPELLATKPNRVWSWDITKLKGPQKGELFYVYTILDIFSRYVVGWMIAPCENAELAVQLFETTCARQQVDGKRLKIHSDRGAPMKAEKFARLLRSLGIGRSFSRPHVSNDNPFSESQFKTFKYQPEFPRRFGSFEDAQSYCQWFFDWYNNQHFHSGLALMTPHMVHSGQGAQVTRRRQRVLDTAFRAHPERFVRGRPLSLRLPEAVWINPPDSAKAAEMLKLALEEELLVKSC